MSLNETSIDYTSPALGVSQQPQGIYMYNIIPLFAIPSLYHNQYPCIKSRYLSGDPTLVHCHLLSLSSLLSSEKTLQKALGLPVDISRATAKRTSDAAPPPPLTN